MNKKERRKQDNLDQLQVALDNDWVKCEVIDNIIQFRMKNKPKIDFMLLESSYINLDNNKAYRSNIKHFLKWFRRA